MWCSRALGKASDCPHACCCGDCDPAGDRRGLHWMLSRVSHATLAGKPDRYRKRGDPGAFTSYKPGGDAVSRTAGPVFAEGDDQEVAFEPVLDVVSSERAAYHFGHAVDDRHGGYVR